LKKIFKKKFLGIPMAIIAVIFVAAVALAAWNVINLTSSGEIQVAAPPPTMEWSVDTDVLVFGETNPVASGGAISVTSAAITVTNDGEADINGITVDVSDLPAGLTATPNVTANYPLITDETATVTVTLTGTAPVGPTTIDLSGITATLTAN